MKRGTIPSYVTEANFRRAKVLVVEAADEQWLCIKQANEQCLPEVEHIRVATPHEALSLLHRWSNEEWDLPKLILLDPHLPDLEAGWRLLKEIDAMPTLISQIPVIGLSSPLTNRELVTAYQLGISCLLLKPNDFPGWLSLFGEVRAYWWCTVALPTLHYR